MHPSRARWGHSSKWAVAFALLLICTTANAAIWPDQLGGFKKASSKPLQLTDMPLWEEYGLGETEQAEYATAARRFTATAFRLQDPTAALGAFEWQRPPDSRQLDLADAAAETRDGVTFLFGNYVFQIAGWKPRLADLEEMLGRLPKLDRGRLPVNYLPSRNLVRNSERFVIGPAGLDRFSPGVPPSTAAFHMGAEVQIARYRAPAGDMQMAVFVYPTPQIARQRVEDFQRLPGAMAKRAGPLVAAILAAPDRDAAERLLATVRFNAAITVNERVPTRRDNVADLLLNIFILVGIIVLLVIPAGVIVGVLRRLGVGTSGEAMTVLHLDDPSRELQPPDAPGSTARPTS